MQKLTFLPFNKKVNFYQNDEHIKASIDSLIVSFFCPLKNKARVLDIGTNNGIILLIIGLRAKLSNIPLSLTGLEINEEALEIAKKNFEINSLEANFICADFNEFSSRQKFDLVVCNPPYFKTDNRSLNNTAIKNAKQEVLLTLKNLIKNTSKIMENRGKFCLIIRADRLDEVINELITQSFYVKIIQPFAAHKEKEAILVYLEAIYKGSYGTTIKPFVIINSKKSNNYSKFLQKKFKLKDN